MKKLMILAATAAMAFAASAASATWGFTSVDTTDRNGDYAGDPTAMTALLYLGAATTSSTTIDLTGLTFIAAAGQNGDYTFGAMSPTAYPSLASDAAGQAYTLLLVEGDGLTTLNQDNTYWMVATTGSSVRNIDPMSGDTWASFINTNTYEASSWANLKVVPEPTSGLLMLLGMAGLALRRRRA